MNNRRAQYEINDRDRRESIRHSEDASSSIPKGPSKMQINIMNIAHGEEDSNIDREKEMSNFKSLQHEENHGEEALQSDIDDISGRKIKFK